MAKLVSSPVFVGREAETTLLDEAYRRASTGASGVVLLGGEAGVGKSRLVDEARARLGTAGALVLRGGCVEVGGDGLPLAPVVEALRRLVRRVGVEEIDDLLGGRRAELGRLLPELADARAGGHGVEGSPPPGIGRLFDLVLGLLERLSADRTVLFVIEDLHWADRSTRDLIGFLARNLRASRVLLVATYRSDELRRGHPLRPFLAELERLRTVDRCELSRFVRPEVAEQIGAILDEKPPADLVDNIHRRSEGNAFFVEELVAAARSGCLDELTPTLRDVLIARVEMLPVPTQDVLRVAKAGGRRVGHRLLVAVTGLPERELWELLRPAVTANVLLTDDDDGSYFFRHALVREALHEETLPGERVDLHRRYAEAVTAEPELAGGGARAAALAAYHWSMAHDLPRALPALVTAARAAAGSYAYAEAHQHLEGALEIWDRVPDTARPAGLDHLGVLALAVDTAHVAGEWQRALGLVTVALEKAAALGDPVRRALILVEQSQLLRKLAIADGVAELEEALRLVPAEPPSAARAHVLAQLGKALTKVPRVAEARAVTEQALALAREVGNRRAEGSALLTLGYAGGPGSLDPVRIAEARQIAREVSDDDLLVRTYVCESDAGLATGDFERTLECGREGMRLAFRIGLARTSAGILAGNVAEALLRLGRWDEAEALITETRDLGQAGVHAVFISGLQAQLALATGRFEDAQRHLDGANQLLTHRFLGAQHTLPLAVVGAEIDIWRGEPLGVPDRVVTALERFDLDDVSRYAAPLLAVGMRAAADAAEQARARRDPHELEFAIDGSHRLARLAGRLPAGFGVEQDAWTVLLAAELTRVDGHPSPAAWSATDHAWAATSQPYMQAYVAHRQAEALLSAGDREAARQAARHAFAVADQLGARPLAREIELLARRGRLSLAEPDTPGPAPATALPATRLVTQVDRLGLTPREVEVLRQLADGRTNPQIAIALFISTKTASTHVSNILAKLGVTTRGEAAAVAHQLRLFDGEPDPLPS
jgi:DNA-binding NarL/FixJ family response regulator